MGIQVKYVIKPANGPFSSTLETQMTDEEDEFYKKFSRNFFCIWEPGSNDKEALWASVSDIFNAIYFGADGSVSSVTHEQFKNLLERDGVVDNKDSAIFQNKAEKSFQRTTFVKIAERATCLVADTAVVIVDYRFEFSQIGQQPLQLSRQDGTWSCTLVRENGKWLLLSIFGN